MKTQGSWKWLFAAEYPEQAESGVLYSVRFSTLQTNSTIANNFILQTGMIYGAVVLMVICLTVLSLQQLLDAGQYKYRFSVLRKLGVDEQHINKLILKQLRVWFGLPIIVAIMVAAVVIWLFYPDHISRSLCIYRFYHIDVTDWGNSGNFGNLIALLFYQHMGYL